MQLEGAGEGKGLEGLAEEMGLNLTALYILSWFAKIWSHVMRFFAIYRKRGACIEKLVI